MGDQVKKRKLPGQDEAQVAAKKRKVNLSSTNKQMYKVNKSKAKGSIHKEGTLSKDTTKCKKITASKNKKWLKKKKKKAGVQSSAKPTLEPAHAPRKPEEFDANWKQLMQKLNDTDRKKTLMPTSKYLKKIGSSPSKEEEKDETIDKPKEVDVWFDDVDDFLIENNKTAKKAEVENSKKSNPLLKPDSFGGLTKVVAMDCEMVGVGEEGKDSILARVSIVNQFGQSVYDRYVRNTEKVTDYRTFVSGIKPEHVQKGEEFSKVQKEVCDILKGRVLVGHALTNDLKVLFLDHPHKKIRDTLRYKPFRRLFQGRNPSLKKLTEKVLSVKVQEGEHDSIQDAQAAMRLYTMHRQQWEKDLKAPKVKTVKRVRPGKKVKPGKKAR